MVVRMKRIWVQLSENVFYWELRGQKIGFSLLVIYDSDK
jgi:hypothetical protein